MSPIVCLVQAYVHRVGRTGRAGQAGTAITLLGAGDAALEAALQRQLGPSPAQQGSAERGAPGAPGSTGAPAAPGLAPFGRLTRAAVEALRYRAEDIARSLTRSAVKEVCDLQGGAEHTERLTSL